MSNKLWITAKLKNRFIVILKQADEILHPDDTPTYELMNQIDGNNTRVLEYTMIDNNLTPEKIKEIKKTMKLGAYINNLVRDWIKENYPEIYKGENNGSKENRS